MQEKLLELDDVELRTSNGNDAFQHATKAGDLRTPTVPGCARQASPAAERARHTRYFRVLVVVFIVSACLVALVHLLSPARAHGPEAPTDPLEAEYDLIVIGAGTAGGVFLSELVERQLAGSESKRVLVIEAGGATLASLGGTDFPP